VLVTLIGKEIAGHVRSLRFALTFVLFVVLFLVSFFVLTSEYQERMRWYTLSRNSHRQVLLQLRDLEDKRQQADQLLSSQGIYADRQPQSLSIFVRGLEESVPAHIRTGRYESHLIDARSHRNPLFSLFTDPDYGYLGNIVVSLLALLFLFDAICGEKERSTLKLVLANPVPRDLVVLGKWIGGYLCLAVPFLAALAGGLVYVVATGAILLDGETLTRLLWIAGVSLLYIALFSSLGLLISTLTSRSSTALLVALFTWVGWVLVVPNLAPVVARLAAPVPTRQKISAENAAIDQETLLRLQRVRRTLLGYGRRAQQAGEEIRREGERRKQRVEQFYEEEMQRQVDLGQALSRLSPAASFRYATTELAATGIGFYASFRKSSRRFQDGFREYAEQVASRRRSGQLADHWLQLEEVPDMRLVPARVADAVAAIYLDLLLLGVYTTLFFVGAYARFLRYDVT
jgi:ABC-type transport system involved in multi-copper enzyme maturation permease subunit